ncbi:alpha/beta hydrolase [Haliea salexigens]|uniref:alpha/beta hydrolase n=1 Tax=Haliea salexigens TaxID=287487 RepID=UPI00040AC6A7|nr:alpha/beta hydrolase [Haliea salexigens]
MLQALRVWATRRYYRHTNAQAWHGKFTDTAYSTLQLPGPHGQLQARMYSSKVGASKPLIIYFHGGGWVIGDLISHHPFCQQLREHTGCTVVAVDYRLAPEHPCPAALQDCLAATHWLLHHAESLGPSDGSFVLAGDSAGGHLAACTALALAPEVRARLAGALLIYPVVDHYSHPYPSYIERARGQTLTSGIMRWFWDTWLAGQEAEDAAAAGALLAGREDLHTLPNCLLVTAERDPLRDEGRALGSALENAGVPLTMQHYPDAEHGFACSQGPGRDFEHFMALTREWLSTLNPKGRH